MALQQQIVGKDASTLLGVDSTHLAAKISERPMHLGASGAAFALSVRSATMAAGLGADSEIFQMRWSHATAKMLLRSLSICAVRQSATAFAAGVFVFRSTIARSFTADGGAGIAIVMSTANTNKKRSDFNLSKFSDTGIRRSDTAALTAGTKTFDTNDFGTVLAFTGVVAPAATVEVAPALVPPNTYLWRRDTGDEYPILFEQNEGFAIRATVPATGTWQFCINVEWAEVDPTEVEGWA